MQHVFNILVGQASGHYILDLVDPLHRQAGKVYHIVDFVLFARFI